MESLQGLKSRMRAVSSVKEIAKAMEVVAATKMRKSQETALRTRPYAYAALGFLEKISRLSSVAHPLALERSGGVTLLAVIASDRGFAGKFNAEVLKKLEVQLAENPLAQILVVGKKAESYLRRKKANIVKSFHGYGDLVKPEEIEPLADFIVSGFAKELWDKVVVVSTHFRTALRQDVLSLQILPIEIEKIRATIREVVPEHGRYSDLRNDIPKENGERSEQDYIFEPSVAEIFSSILPHLLKMQIYDIILEANASEHSARRVAMKNASDNAAELSDELSLSYNKARQSHITTELIEITATQSALA